MKSKTSSVSLQKLYINIFVIFIASMALIIFFILPYIKGVKKAYASFLEKKTEIETLIKHGSTGTMLKKQLALHEDQLLFLKKSLIKEGNELEFIQVLENLGEKYKVDQKIGITEKTASSHNNQTFMTSVITLQMEGVFSDILQYVAALENGPYYININSMYIKSISKQELISSPSIVSGQENENSISSYQTDLINQPTGNDYLSAQDKAEQILSVNAVAEVFWQ